eukprot:Protomagalhaensia_sp_Gyna_25__1047@NODE_1504_length_1777_cov_42_191024_g1219_i0_p1_GENE_NODE_1504_length_1777_cov_42_191024_g1219_i0NODE_1504_length_1777_cov_42_191024_g1219_i0_p1_ORF_typecomplete_len565_score60_89AA_permease/PF00324_21/1_3e140AA_permease_2/PF13520_6/4e54Trp_Tyr_perm/PF03222_13/2_8e07Aa_trans/PF01490_18/7e05_NODE_1504_length_1777_cov_42_191024_g1219_i0391697
MGDVIDLTAGAEPDTPTGLMARARSSVSSDPEAGNGNAFVKDGQDEDATKRQDVLARDLSNRQVQMISIGGTIGTGIFLGTASSLSAGGPASLLITYAVCGFCTYFTMLCLGEISAYMPIAGSFNTYASRFLDEGIGFALIWNYWFNNAMTVATSLVAAEMLIGYWSTDFPAWIISIVLLAIMTASNALGVKYFGEIEYWFSIFKIICFQLFLIVSILVNVGVNTDKEYIGFRNWSIGNAPFVEGFSGFATVFVAASFAYGGVESLGVTAGETKNPRKNMPIVIKNVMYRVMVYYLVGVFFIGLNIPYNLEALTAGNSFSSPITLTFAYLGVPGAAHVINAVILTAVLSVGNQALFAATRLMFAMAREGQAPKIFGYLTGKQVPLWAMLITTATGCVCFASSFIGGGTLWVYLQALVGVSNQIAWVACGWTSYRFRRAMLAQGRSPNDELPFVNRFYSWAPLFVVIANCIFILVQGYPSFVNGFEISEFITFYAQVPIFIVMWLIWKWVHKTKYVPLKEMDIDTDKYVDTAEDIAQNAEVQSIWKRILNWIL